MPYHANIEPISGCLRFYAPGKTVDVDPYEVAATVVWLDRQTVEIKGMTTRRKPDDKKDDAAVELIRLRTALCTELRRFGVTKAIITRRKPGRPPRKFPIRIPAAISP